MELTKRRFEEEPKNYAVYDGFSMEIELTAKRIYGVLRSVLETPNVSTHQPGYVDLGMLVAAMDTAMYGVLSDLDPAVAKEYRDLWTPFLNGSLAAAIQAQPEPVTEVKQVGIEKAGARAAITLPGGVGMWKAKLDRGQIIAWNCFLEMPEHVQHVKTLIGQNVVVTMIQIEDKEKIVATEILPEYSKEKTFGAAMERALELRKAHPTSSPDFALLAWQAGDRFETPSEIAIIHIMMENITDNKIEIDGKMVTLTEEIMKEAEKLPSTMIVPRTKEAD